jgi:VWFA-related protein
MEQDRGSQFIRHVMRRGDQGFLSTFDVNVELQQEYTNNQESLIHALSQAKINGGGGVPPVKEAPGVPPWTHNKPAINPDPVPIANPGGTHFYDAIYQAANEQMSQVTGRKAMIVLTDGDDQNSEMTSQDAVAEADKNNVSVFVIWSGDPKCFAFKDRRMPWEKQYPSPGDPTPRTPNVQGDEREECDATHWKKATCPGYYAAQCIAEHTGGRLIAPQNSKQIEHAFEQVQDALRSQYWVSYTPSDSKADGHFHRLEIQCHAENGQNLKVQMRRGYYADSMDK